VSRASLRTPSALLLSILLAATAACVAEPVRSHETAGAHGTGAHHRWGLPGPLPAPPGRPDRTGVRALRPPARGLPRVVDRVPTRDRVVFLAFDDGAERDPRFVHLVRELRLPVTVFLTDQVVGPGYAHFARLRSAGVSLENHTLDHRRLPGLPYAGQRAEICGQQNKLKSRFGVHPRLFQPPYGAYDTTTLRAAAACGITALILGRTAGPHPPHPGDILIIPDEPGRSETETTLDLLRRVQGEGLAVARLENYLAP